MRVDEIAEKIARLHKQKRQAHKRGYHRAAAEIDDDIKLLEAERENSHPYQRRQAND